MNRNELLKFPYSSKPDFKSLKFKLWLHFFLFIVLVLGLLWFLQIFFLNHYYEEMKIKDTNKIAHEIMMMYGDEDFIDTVSDLSSINDMYIHIEASDGSIIFEPATYGDKHAGYAAYIRSIDRMKNELVNSSSKSVALTVPVADTNYKMLSYATYLDTTPEHEIVLYLFSPLYPVESTISILQNQLFTVTILSLIVASFIGIILARRIAKPIDDINKTAKQLAKGEFGIIFHGGHYSEIINLADTLTYTSIELEKASRLQVDLMANVSHDIRTPLTMVKSYAEMIRDISGDNPQKRSAHLQVIIDEADRLNVLVTDMMELSKMQSGVAVLEKRVFSVREATESILQSYGVLIEQEGYTIIFNCPEDIKINADEAKIKQVISNLINNAVKYCGVDRTVYISALRTGSRLRFEVTDHGMGIEPSELEHIWDRYYKSSTNHVRNTTGSGLGLSIVKNILILHKAEFGVNSEIGKGSTFWFELKI